jgi:hypothetical protein
MSSTIDEYKAIGLTLINTAEKHIDTEPIQNEVASIGKEIEIYPKVFFSIFSSYLDKSWSEYIEYILDTIDYIQLHQEELHEFQVLSNDSIKLLNEKQAHFEILIDEELKNFHDDLEKFYEQVELLNQKGELLLQSSATNVNDDNENPIERSLETINRNYDSLSTKTKARLQNTNNTEAPIQSITTEEKVKEKK